MKTSRVILNDRTKKKKSSFHKICTYEHPTPYFESEELHGYEFTHIKSPQQQLVFHKQEIRPTPISLPTPPASPEFWGTSLQKWYQKKPLFTLTAKGQVKRLEKYLEIQKTLEMCKKEHEFQVYTQDMKKAYLDFEFREHQPLLYEDKDVCCVCPCNSSRKYDIDFIPVDYVSCNLPKPKLCICSSVDEEKVETLEKNYQPPHFGYPSHKNEVELNNFDMHQIIPTIDAEQIIPTKIIKEVDKDLDDRGIYKVIVKNKQLPNTQSARYVMKLYDNQNFQAEDNVYYMNEKLNSIHEISNNKENGSRLSKINLGNIAELPFDHNSNSYGSPRSDYSSQNCSSYCSCCHSGKKNLTRMQKVKYDMNKNEIFE